MQPMQEKFMLSLPNEGSLGARLAYVAISALVIALVTALALWPHAIAVALGACIYKMFIRHS